MWNGTAATLNPNPTSTSPRPRSSIGLRSRERERTCVAIWVKLVVPVAPYTSAMPYSRTPEANAPSRKYLSAASAAAPLLRSIPASTYRHRHQLEPEEDHHQVFPARHQHHAQGCEQQQDVILRHEQPFALQVVERDEHGEPRGGEEQAVRDEAEVVHRDEGRRARRSCGVPPQPPHGSPGGGEAGHRRPAGDPLVPGARVPPRRHEQDEQGGRGQPQLGQEGARQVGAAREIEVHRVAVIVAASIRTDWMRLMAAGSMRRRTGAGYTPIHTMQASSGNSTASSRGDRSGSFSFSGLSSGL